MVLNWPQLLFLRQRACVRVPVAVGLCVAWLGTTTAQTLEEDAATPLQAVAALQTRDDFRQRLNRIMDCVSLPVNSIS